MHFFQIVQFLMKLHFSKEKFSVGKFLLWEKKISHLLNFILCFLYSVHLTQLYKCWTDTCTTTTISRHESLTPSVSTKVYYKTDIVARCVLQMEGCLGVKY